MLRFFLAGLFFFHITAVAQVDPKKLDSLARSIDSSANAYHQQQEFVVKTQDSIYHSEINKNLGKSWQKDPSLPGQNQRKELLVRVTLGILLLAILAVILLRKRKPKV